jgi:hypothetical protein
VKLPYEPESIEAINLRMRSALDRLWVVADLRLDDDTVPRPSKDRNHVFDYSDGLRLIISREDYGGVYRSVAHLSASVQPNTQLSYRMHLRLLNLESILAFAVRRFTTGTGQRDIAFWNFSGGAIPHWYSKNFVAHLRAEQHRLDRDKENSQWN